MNAAGVTHGLQSAWPAACGNGAECDVCHYSMDSEG